MQISKDFLNMVQNKQNDLAKSYWWASKLAQASILAIGITTTLVNNSPPEIAILISFLSVFSVAMQWISDHWKGAAQTVLRKYEFLNGLGWIVTSHELRSLHVSLPKDFREQLDKETVVQADYFASKAEVSTKRLIENLSESTFWSRHLSFTSMIIFLIITVSIFLASFTILAVAISNPTNQNPGITFVKIAISVLTFAFTAGFARQTYDFYRFSQESQRIESISSAMLEKGITDNDNQEAIKLCHQYQIARAGSPLIPTRVWKMRQKELNQIWQLHHPVTVGPPQP